MVVEDASQDIEEVVHVPLVEMTSIVDYISCPPEDDRDQCIEMATNGPKCPLLHHPSLGLQQFLTPTLAVLW